VRRTTLFLGALVFIQAESCKGSDDPEAIARRFVDAYYVEYDFDHALELADGAAVERLQQEKALVDDARQKVPVAQSRSRTYYEAPEKRLVKDDLAHFTFDLEIRQGSSTIARTAVILVARRQDAWKVIGFREGEGQGAQPIGAVGPGGVPTSTGAARRETRTSSTR
jgi:hypothetical protein